MLHEKQVKSVLNKHKQRDSWFLDEYSVNPYEGCSCNCLYCYIRGSKYGENMEEGLVVKSNALEILEKQLAARAKKNQYGIVTVGSAIDAYMKHEEKLRLTEGILKLLLKYRFPVFISTKTQLILRDIEILKQIDKSAILPEDLKNSLGCGVILSTSISTINSEVSNMLEPGAATPGERLKTLKLLHQEGFLTGVNAIPILPFISDTEEELEKIIVAAKQAEAEYVLIGGLTLFGSQAADSKILYFNFLKRYNPLLTQKYEKLYRLNFFPPKQYLQELKEKSERLCAKHGIRTRILNQNAEGTQRNTTVSQNKLL
jgi:DNA repair photolyase